MVSATVFLLLAQPAAGFAAAAPLRAPAPTMQIDGSIFEVHQRQFVELRAPGPGPDHPPLNVADVFVHAAASDVFWFVGKSCSRLGAGGEDGPALSVVLQKRLILEHAKTLQPSELGRAEQLEVWCAPPNSAVAVGPEMQPLSSPALGDDDAAAALAQDDVGFLPEPRAADGATGAHVRLRPDGSFPLNCEWLCLVARDP